MKNQINGLVSDALKKSANAFLYIFIAADANLGNAIMTKRKNQMFWLKLISDVDWAYNWDEVVAIVRQGIIDRYGMEPAEVLQKIYNVATTPAVGSSISDAATKKATADLNILATDPTTGTKANKNIWTDIAGVIEWIIKIFNSLGITKGASSTETVPTSGDWGSIPTDSNISSAGMGTYLPYVFGAAIVYTLFTNGTKK